MKRSRVRRDVSGRSGRRRGSQKLGTWTAGAPAAARAAGVCAVAEPPTGAVSASASSQIAVQRLYIVFTTITNVSRLRELCRRAGERRDSVAYRPKPAPEQGKLRLRRGVGRMEAVGTPRAGWDRAAAPG